MLELPARTGAGKQIVYVIDFRIERELLAETQQQAGRGGHVVFLVTAGTAGPARPLGHLPPAVIRQLQ